MKPLLVIFSALLVVPINVICFVSPLAFNLPFWSYSNFASEITWPFANVSFKSLTLFFNSTSCLALSTIPKSTLLILYISSSPSDDVVILLLVSILKFINGVVDFIVSGLLPLLFLKASIP